MVEEQMQCRGVEPAGAASLYREHPRVHESLCDHAVTIRHGNTQERARSWDPQVGISGRSVAVATIGPHGNLEHVLSVRHLVSVGPRLATWWFLHAGRRHMPDAGRPRGCRRGPPSGRAVAGTSAAARTLLNHPAVHAQARPALLTPTRDLRIDSLTAQLITMTVRVMSPVGMEGDGADDHADPVPAARPATTAGRVPTTRRARSMVVAGPSSRCDQQQRLSSHSEIVFGANS